MENTTTDIRGYTYGKAEVAQSPLSIADLESLMISAGFTDEDQRYLRLAGEVLTGQARPIVEHWRSRLIAGIPHLARHSRTPEGEPIPSYLASSNLRFEQWILDTCRRPYDQDWLNYQEEIARRHMAPKKNTVDGVQSTPYVPFRDIIAFTAVMNQTIKPYLTAKGHSQDDVDKMHLAWCRSLQLQLAIWARLYTDSTVVPSEW